MFAQQNKTSWSEVFTALLMSSIFFCCIAPYRLVIFTNV